LNQLVATLFEVDVEKLVTDLFDLMCDGLLSLGGGVFRCAKFSSEALREHVLFQVHDVHDLLLKVSEAVSEVLVLIAHSTVDLLLFFGDHQMEVVVARDLAKFEFIVAFDN